MNRMIMLSMLALSACASTSGAMGNSDGSFAGPWRGVVVKGEARSTADFRFAGSDGRYHGFFWSRTLTPIALNDVHLGPSVHFEVPEMGVFDGTSSGEVMEGRFVDATGEGWFRLEKEFDSDAHPETP
jgi:hypothetical protein